jgi:hypothetical protein
MKIYELLKKVCQCFNQLNIPYLVTGSIASIAYGEARFTNDIDIVADIKKKHIRDILNCFPEEKFYLSEDSIKDAIVRKFQFNIIHPASGLKVDVIIKKKSEFDDMRFSRVKNFQMDDVGVSFSAPEDVILKKMEYYKMGGSEKHLRDIIGIIRISEELIQFDYIETWVNKLCLEEIWNSIKNRLKNTACSHFNQVN